MFEKCLQKYEICGNIISKINGREVLVVSRKILCEACGSVLNEDILKQKNSLNTCLVCGASLGMDESESAPEEELVDWYYYEFKDGSGTGSLRDKSIDLEKFGDTYELKYTFKAPPRDENGSSKAAKEVLRREYKPDAFMESETSKVVTKPDALWIAEGKCPRCHSSNIQLVQRKFSILTGFRSSKIDRVCVVCKYKF